jgi:hypothetical protein
MATTRSRLPSASLSRAVAEPLEGRRLLSGDTGTSTATAAFTASTAGDRFESNDTPSTATDLGTLGIVVERGLDVTNMEDLDWFRFDVAQSGPITIDALQAASFSDIYATLYTDSFIEIRQQNSWIDESPINADAVAGQTYYLKIESNASFGSELYDLTIRAGEVPLVPDRFEANDTQSSATNLGEIGYRYESSLSINTANDEDWFVLNTNEDDYFLTIDLEFDHAMGDLNVELLDDRGIPVPGGDSTTNDESVSLRVFAGAFYYFRVYGENGETGNYDMSTYLAPPADRFEPNDTISSATPLGTVATRVESNLSISSTDDVDLYSFEAASTGAVEVDVLFHHAAGRDIDIEVWDSFGEFIDGGFSDTDNERVVADVVAGETYYIFVEGFEGTNTYSLSIDTIAFLLPDFFEDNDTFVTPTLLGDVESMQIGALTIDRPWDDDWFAFDATGYGEAVVTIDYDWTQGDLDLFIYDDQANLIASSETASNEELVTFTIEAGGRYLPRIISARGETADYTLTIEATPVAPELVNATFVAAPTRPVPQVAFEFTQIVEGSVAASDLIVSNDSTGQTFFADAVELISENLAVFDLPTDLPDGDYTAVLPAGSVSNGNRPLAQDAVANFFILAGDANRDRQVNLADFGILRGNFGTSQASFAEGDFNYDGQVNLADFGILRGNFGASLAPPTASLFADDDEAFPQ